MGNLSRGWIRVSCVQDGHLGIAWGGAGPTVPAVCCFVAATPIKPEPHKCEESECYYLPPAAPSPMTPCEGAGNASAAKIRLPTVKTGINTPQTVEGKWWINGEDKPSHFGVLSFDPEAGLELVVKLPQSRGVGEVVWGCLNKAEGTECGVPKIIFGADENDRPLTLFGCYCPGPEGSMGLETFRISSVACLRNIRSRSFRAVQFPAVSVRYTHFHQWMRRQIPGNYSGGNDLPDIVVEIEEGVSCRIRPSIWRSVSLDEQKLKFDHHVAFHFSEARPLQTVREDYVGVFLRLMCLLTGQRVFCDKITFLNRDPNLPSLEDLQSVELLQKCSGITRATRKCSWVDMVTNYKEVEESFAPVVRKWFQVHRVLEPVVELLLAVKSNRPSTIESQFLFLAQALEVYHSRNPQFSSVEHPVDQHRTKVKQIICSAPKEHRKWLAGKLAFANQKTLAARIDEVLSLHPAEVSVLTQGIESFGEKVRHTRNYYTHYHQGLLKKKRIAEGSELIRITFALEALLQICLLKELGISGEPIGRILNTIRQMQIISPYTDS